MRTKKSAGGMWAALFGLVLLAVVAAGAHAQSDTADKKLDLTQVYLIQTSGWMEPFYADNGSQFRVVISSLIDSTQIVGVDTLIATFNQNGQVAGHVSPEQIFAGGYDAGKVKKLLDAIEPPRRADGKYADSDFFGALNGTTNDLLHGHQGIIWMVTNNKASPNNSQEVIQNTQKFYTNLRDLAVIERIVAFPIRMRVQGPHYNERGFIIYGIAYGDTAAQALEFLVADGQPLRKFFTSPPVRIKPLDQDPVRLELTRPVSKPVVATLENGVLILRHVPASKATELHLTGQLVNSYYPQEIQASRLSIDGSLDGRQAITATIVPTKIDHLQPRAALSNIVLGLNIPPVKRTSIFQDHVQVDGIIYIRLNDARLGLSEEFVSQMKDVFGINLLMEDQRQVRPNDLPEVFFDYQRVRSAATAIPVHVVYDFSPWPLILAAAGGLMLLGGLIGGAVLMFLPRRHVVRIGGSNIIVRLRGLETQTVQSPTGVRARVHGRLFGKPAVEVIETDKETSAKS